MSIKNYFKCGTLIGTCIATANYINWHNFNKKKLDTEEYNSSHQYKILYCVSKGFIYSQLYPLIMLNVIYNICYKKQTMKHIYPGSIHGDTQDKKDFEEWINQ